MQVWSNFKLFEKTTWVQIRNKILDQIAFLNHLNHTFEFKLEFACLFEARKKRDSEQNIRQYVKMTRLKNVSFLLF